MKKILLSTVLLSISLFANEGYEVYKKNCMSCHVEVMSKKEVMANLKNMKAPPMIEVSGRLKENIRTTDEEDDVDRHLFILFVKDYIMNPDLEFSMCHAGAIERFGTMPSMKKQITKKEAKAVAIWLYDRYENIDFK
ncbi:cytochrome c [Sulfurimonas sp. SAG-AH-194-I05]|nr:c-type cytochrome [Sulfurimonas sp. SAG-AH-194-I05]MDF1874669.1 cytochrome c [Sulfurimonas sp. SAG-AH-194-I05]